MGKEDIAVNRLLERKTVFADLVNGSLYGGRQMIAPEELELLSPRAGTVLPAEKKKEKVRLPLIGRAGDIRMKAKKGTYSVIFANETQAGVHYAMPVRTMLYDALEYVKQVQDLEKKHREKRDLTDSDEFLSGISKEDFLLPVVNMVLYLGDDWNGSRSLHEMMGIDWRFEGAKELRPYVSDYRINLIPVRSIQQPENYKTCLRQIFSMLKYDKEDKEKLYRYIRSHRKELDRMDRVEEQAALILLGEQGRLKELIDERRSGEKEEIGMRPVLTELIEYREAKGEERGMERGQTRIMELNRILLREKRYEELEQASADKAYMDRLCRELGI